MATLKTFADFDVQTLIDTVKGVYAGKNVFVDSVLQSSGAVQINSSMPKQSSARIGKNIDIPYFGTMGEFADNAENVAATIASIAMGHETATVGRGSLAFETTTWSRNVGPDGGDPYVEMAEQIRVAGKRYMDGKIVTAAAATPLVVDVYNSSTSPVYLDWDGIVDALSMFGDEDSDVVAMAITSKTKAGLRKLKDSTGRPLLVDSMKVGDIPTFCGVPLLTTDRLPMTGSTMKAVTESGASVGGVTLTGTPTGAWNLKIDIITGGARGTATFRFSTDGGNTYSDLMTTAASVPLIDANEDSLVGNNGTTGLTAVFGVATYDALSVYSSTANIKTTSLLLQRGALAFWFAGDHMDLKTDIDILKDNDVAAMHIYHAAHMYRRRPGGTKPGVVAIKHNVQGFTGL